MARLSAAHRYTFVVGLLTALVVAAYGLSLRNELVFDDRIFMEHDTRLRSLSQALRLFVEPLWGFTDDDGRTHAHQYYRPLQTLPLALSRAAFGEAAWPSHLLNLVVHWLNVLLVFALIRRVLDGSAESTAPSNRSRATSIPFFAAALFAVHPGYNEAVLWVSNIAGLGVAFCTLAIMLIHMSPLAQRWDVQALVALLFLAGLWFKEAGVLVPVLMLLYDVTLGRSGGVRWRRYAILAPPLGVYVWLRLHALGGALPGIETVPLTPYELAINAVALLPQYMRTFFWPVDLNMYHDFDAIHSIWNVSFACGATLLLVAAGVTLVCWRQHPAISFGIVWMVVTVSPHLLARWPQLNVYAERYLYLPAVGAFLIAAYVVDCVSVARTGRVLRWATFALLLAAIAIDVRRARDWHDEVTLYSKTLTQSRRAELIRINLGLRFYQLGRYDEGIAVLRELVRFDPSWHDAWHNLGLLYLAQQREGDALTAFEHARQRDASSAETLLNLGFLYDRQGRRDAALDAYFRALRWQPKNVKVWFNLAAIAIELEQFGNAREALETILRINPNDRAAAHALRGLRASPPSASAVATERRCAAAKAAVDEGRYDDAVVALQVAAWYDEASPLPHQYLANVHYLAGRIRRAVRHQREALERAPDNELYRRNLASLESTLPESARE